MNKKIYRSRNDKMIGGVCGGIAEYFDIDSTIIRLIAILLFFAEGLGFLLYIISWIVIPEDPYSSSKSSNTSNNTIDVDGYNTELDKDYGNNINNDNIDGHFDKTNDKKSKSFKFADEEKDENRQKTIGIILVALGSIFLIDNWLPFFRWERFWPLILVGFGVVLIFKGVKDNE